jgi:Uma2 family endonuclease
MGNLATPEALIARWEEVCRDPSLQELPYKIELNAWGKVEMSPASNRHSRLQGIIALALGTQLKDGGILPECSILTSIGIRVPDVGWASSSFLAAYGEITPFMRAPEICVEVISPSNVEAEIEEKKRAYLAAGAEEVWLVSEEGSIRYFGASGEKAQSDFPVVVTLPPPMKGKP